MTSLRVFDAFWPSELRRKLIELPTGRAIALGRLTLAVTCAAAVAISPPDDSGARRVIAIVLLAYLLFSATLVALPRLPREDWFYGLQHAIDIAATSALIVFSDVSTNPYFTLFVFSLVVGLLRWNWRGALVTAIALAGVLFLLPSKFVITPDGLRILDADLSRVVVRGGFLLVCGAMLAYLGAHRERTRLRFAQLASWPAAEASEYGPGSLARFLAHAAMVLQAPRVLLVWEEEDEPVLNVALWTGRGLEHTREPPGSFDELFAEDGTEVSFCGPQQNTASGHAIGTHRLPLELQRRFGIRTAAAASFRSQVCVGRVYMLDRPTWIDEDVPIVQIIAQRLGVEIEEWTLRQRLADMAMSRERVRVGRDLHDGVLQGLAAASLQLKVLSAQVEAGLQPRVAAIRGTLADEARRIRTFVEENRTSVLPSSDGVSAKDRIERRANALAAQWGCTVTIAVDPPELVTSASVAHHLDHLVTEGVSNAVRHGRASRVAVELTQNAVGLILRMKDDGTGFTSASAGRPMSLRARAEDLGGRLTIGSSPGGADVEIELPA